MKALAEQINELDGVEQGDRVKELSDKGAWC
jgi:hypothetical protein